MDKELDFSKNEMIDSDFSKFKGKQIAEVSQFFNCIYVLFTDGTKCNIEANSNCEIAVQEVTDNILPERSNHGEVSGKAN